MKLISDCIGYRLQLNEGTFHIGNSVKVHKGLVGRVMVLFGLAVKQKFLQDNGEIEILALSKRSIARYLYCSMKCARYPENAYVDAMDRKYKKADSSYAYCYFAKKIAKEATKIVSQNPQKLSQFINTLRSYKPKILQYSAKPVFYKIKKNGQTVGYLVGTQHPVPKNMSKLHYSIREAVLKSQTIATEVKKSFLNSLVLHVHFIYKMATNKKFRDAMFLLAKVSASTNEPTEHSTETKILKIGRKGWGTNIGLESVRDQLNEIEKVCCSSLAGSSVDNVSMPASQKEAPKDERYDDESSLNQKFEKMKKMGSGSVWLKSLTDRNVAMKNKLLPLLERSSKHQRIFIAVGALHLVGEIGLLQLLGQEQSIKIIKGAERGRVLRFG